MRPGWVAGTVRAAALARRRCGDAQLRELAREPGVRPAVTRLAATAYGHDVRVEHDVDAAQRAVAATLLWHLRVLAGWLPGRGAHVLRVLAAGFEVANVDEHLHAWGRAEPTRPPYVLGALETAWSRLARTRTPNQLRAALASSPWGDPGSAHPWDIHQAMTLGWAERVVAVVPAAAEWARGAAAVTVLREALLGRQPAPGSGIAARTARVLGPAFAEAVTGPAPTLRDAAARLPRSTRTLFRDASGPDGLWGVELAWVHRLEDEGSELLRRRGHGADPVVGAVALLAVDAWRARAALAAAARGGVPTPAGPGPAAAEVFDDLA